jgi:EAL domain-containing protein (putative c-di-GMP-specific phosphodiesterase class I)
MTDQALLERIFVLRPTSERGDGTPPRALVISLVALAVAVVGSLVSPEAVEETRGFLWILGLVPCLLLSYYRGWKGASFALVLGMLAITGAELARNFLLGEEMDWWIYGAASAALVTASLGVGVITEMLHRSGGDPHLADRRRQTGRELARGLDRDEFVVHYQPIVDLETGRVAAAEALVRWEHPRSGFLPSDLFLPSAEATGLIVELGRWITGQVCRDLSRWRLHLDDPPGFRLHLNVSPPQCETRSALDRSILDVLEGTGTPAERLCFELPESTLVEASDGVERLRRTGAGIVVDDFGTEEASLSNLMWLEAEGLKVDRSFTSEILDNPRCAAIVEAILTLGRRLDLLVTAEGVETPDQLRWLRERGCPAVQGFLLAEPAPLEEALEQVKGVRGRLQRALETLGSTPGSRPG